MPSERRQESLPRKKLFAQRESFKQEMGRKIEANRKNRPSRQAANPSVQTFLERRKKIRDSYRR